AASTTAPSAAARDEDQQRQGRETAEGGRHAPFLPCGPREGRTPTEPPRRGWRRGGGAAGRSERSGAPDREARHAASPSGAWRHFAGVAASADGAGPDGGSGAGTRFLTAGIVRRYENTAARSSSVICAYISAGMGGRSGRPRP